MKLVIVDDDIALLNALSRRFSQRGFTVVSFAEAVTTDQLTAQQADTYLLDLRFASQSGLSFIAPLRQALPACRIVLLTGYASIANAVQAVKLGADDYLTKPVDLLQLEQALRSESQAITHTMQDTAAVLSPDQLEWEHINRVLSEQNGNISRTAELLGMHRRTLQRKLAKHRP
ncbi:response regulator transcription factor [Rheinheimera baltica]|uniref:Response regulator n=1 Tax=Rheinheimera baltica TaxID=67576 RepID=A0ABT9I487_9GAMM|nr:response regulator [Rheinheimera baltica]MDP5138193.1 response regulator [Rheinheimera baltica]MDP5142803.1 response regulator [Rheinheimera baltica]MDP5188962.1 response regulator [Rheinheimera baltica]